MSNQLKLLFYILFVAVIFYLVQNRFSLFDVQLLDSNQMSQQDVLKEEDVKEGEYVDIYNIDHSVVRVSVEVVDDAVGRSIGLSGRRVLGDYNGMLFIFDQEGGYPFWMKDMFLSLDILFIDAEGFIVDIRKDLEPCSADFCPNVVSNVPFKYALEVNSGFSELNGVVVGNSVILNLSMD